MMKKISIETAKIVRDAMDEIIKSSNKQLKKFTDVKTFEDALLFSGKKEEDVLPFLSSDNDEQKWHNTMAKLRLIALVISGDWKADWSNNKQKKWRCWFDWNTKSSAFVFDVTGYGWAGTFTDVGSRLCFETEEQAKYFATQFIDLHNIVLIN